MHQTVPLSDERLRRRRQLAFAGMAFAMVIFGANFVVSRHAVLKNRVALLNPDRADPDMVDELARRKLNVAHPDEVIVPLTK